MPEPIDLDEARAHAANYRGELSRLGMVTPMLMEALIAEVARLREALKPFSEVPPGGYGPEERLLVASAGSGPFHLYESDFIRAKVYFRSTASSPFLR